MNEYLDYFKAAIETGIFGLAVTALVKYTTFSNKLETIEKSIEKLTLKTDTYLKDWRNELRT